MLSGGIPYVDILIFAVIAIFLGFRLHSVLGKRSGFEQDLARDQEMVDALKAKAKPEEATPEADSSKSGKGVAILKKADPYFDEKSFLKGAESAFAMILKAFADNDIETLKPLLGYEMNMSFADAIKERQLEREQLSINLVELKKASIAEVNLNEGVASIEVEYISKQQRVLRSEDGSVIDGDEKKTQNFHDRWTFERDIHSQDPNWLLVETESIEK